MLYDLVQEFKAFPMDQRAAAPQAFEATNLKGNGCEVFVNITAIGGASTLTVNIEVQDPMSKEWVLLLASAALAATGLTRLEIGPGIATVANVSKNTRLGYRVRIRPVHSDAGNITYSIGGSVFPE